jgi:hypothetical protein
MIFGAQVGLNGDVTNKYFQTQVIRYLNSLAILGASVTIFSN